jgi:hypothetical protein
MGISSQTLGLATNAVKSAGSRSLSQFLGQAAQGDLSGALSSLASAPGELLGSIGSYGQATPGDAFRGMQQRGDAIQNWCWYCLLPTLNNSSALSIGGFKPSVSLPWYYVSRMNTPMRTIETETVRRNAHGIHLPTGYSIGSMSAEFFLDSKNEALNYLKAWAGLVLEHGNPAQFQTRGAWGMPADYKKEINVYALSVKKQVLLNFKYFGCWPSDPTALDWTSDDATAVTQQVTFQVEDVQVTVLNDKGVIDNLTQTALGYGLSALTGSATSFLKGFGL